MKEMFLKLRIEIDPDANPEPSSDDVVKAVKELLTVGMEGTGGVPFGVRDVTLLEP
jgi:hypothetical protein